MKIRGTVYTFQRTCYNVPIDAENMDSEMLPLRTTEELKTVHVIGLASPSLLTETMHVKCH